jgi:hypothetical protein
MICHVETVFVEDLALRPLDFARGGEPVEPQAQGGDPSINSGSP